MSSRAVATLDDYTIWLLENEAETISEMWNGSNKHPNAKPVKLLSSDQETFERIQHSFGRCKRFLYFEQSKATTNDGIEYTVYKPVIIKTMTNNGIDLNNLPIIYFTYELIDRIYIVLSTLLHTPNGEGYRDQYINRLFTSLAKIIKYRLLTINATSHYGQVLELIYKNLTNKNKLLRRTLSKEVKHTEETSLTPTEIKNLYTLVTPSVKINKTLVNRGTLRDYLDFDCTQVSSTYRNTTKMLHWRFLLLSATGMRISDASNIYWRQVNEDKDNDCYWVELTIKKTQSTHRMVFPRSLNPHIREWLEVAKEVNQKGGPAPRDQKLFYIEESLSTKKRDIAIAFLNKYVIGNRKEVIETTRSHRGKQIKVTETRAEHFVKSHSFRHHIAQVTMRNGATKEEVASLLGHLGISNVQKYARVERLNQYSLKNANLIDNIIRGSEVGGKVVQEAAVMTAISGGITVDNIQNIIAEAIRKGLELGGRKTPDVLQVYDTQPGTVTQFESTDVMRDAIQYPQLSTSLKRRGEATERVQKKASNRPSKKMVAKMDVQDVDTFTKNTRRLNRNKTTIAKAPARMEVKIKKDAERVKQIPVVKPAPVKQLPAPKPVLTPEEYQAKKDYYYNIDLSTVKTYEEASTLIVSLMADLKFDDYSSLLTKFIMHKSKLPKTLV